MAIVMQLIRFSMEILKKNRQKIPNFSLISVVKKSGKYHIHNQLFLLLKIKSAVLEWF